MSLQELLEEGAVKKEGPMKGTDRVHSHRLDQAQSAVDPFVVKHSKTVRFTTRSFIWTHHVLNSVCFRTG